MPGLFNKKILDERIKNYEINNLDDKIIKIKEWQKNLGRIKGLNEKRLQGAFLRAIFEDILGYENTPQKDNWTLDIEATTDVDAKHPDGIIGFFERTDNEEIRSHEAVIELKGPQISLDKDQKRQGTTYKSPVDQAFSYTNKLDKCKWVIVSNFMEIRLYKVGRSKEYFEVFLLDDLDKIETFKKFYYLLNKDNLLSETGNSITLELSEKTLKKEEDISVKFYNLYKNVRINLFEHLKENNDDKDPELLLEKAQKFLDRIIFIGFCEDKGLLPNDLLHEAIQRGKDSFSPSDTAVWDQIRGVFRSIDKGNAAHNINAYNGGLFEYDEDLDGLVIANDFFETIYKISDYDFDSDVDVNILGHIFEQSISDLEKLKSDIKDDEFDKNKSKRKKDGIFYTPQYITSYIVENAIGGYLEDLKEELGYYELPDIEDAGSKNWKTIYTNQHLDFYNKYEEELKDIKVLDPACGSGAFLNQAFDYLLKEHQWLNKQRDLLKGGQSSIFALDAIQRNILKNNIFGVDLNEESVEITKLSLWLKTANKRKPLTNLDKNIKCGNSLISDPEFSQDKAFDWKSEFKNIMSKGGFDIVIGNPPYVKRQNIDSADLITYYEDNYKSAYYNFDLYMLFLEKGASLINDDGYLGYILPSKFVTTQTGTKLRELIQDEYNIAEYVDFDDFQVFTDATTYTCLLFLNKKKQEKAKYLKINKEEPEKVSLYDLKNIFIIKTETGWLFSDSHVNISEKIDGVKLKEFVNTFTGIETGADSIYILDNENENYDKFLKYEGDIVHKVLKGKNLEKYYFDKNRYIVIVPYNHDGNLFSLASIDNKYPEIYEYLKSYKKELEGRESGKMENEKWYGYVYPKNLNKYDTKRIIWADIASKPAFSLDEKDFVWHVRTIGSLEIIENEEHRITYKQLLGILNSNLFHYFIKNHSNVVRGGYYRFRPRYILEFSIPRNLDKNLKDKLNLKVEKILNNKNKLKKQRKTNLNYFIDKYTSKLNNLSFNSIINDVEFKNEIYSGRASKIRNFTVNINTNVITIYLDKSSSGKYEVLKFEENDKYKKQYIKYYLENLTDEQLDEIDNKFSGNILKKTLQIEIPDYNKEHVVKKVVKEWESLQQEIIDLKNEIEKIDNEIDQMVYKLYNLTEEEIHIVEESLED
ncbi:MAG: Eco57I restriction endonuclease [Halanaerobium sp.]|nr:MAG: Eco57I restriction endonuclease [Halanaerobium sp.]